MVQQTKPSVELLPFKYKHFQLLLDLHASQNSPTGKIITYRTLPKIGYIAMLGDQPVAAGFLRRLEPCYAQLDTLVSSAHFGSNVRHLGITAVVDALINEAKRLKLEGLLALTADKGTLLRAEGLGFHVVEQTVIALTLTQE